MIDPSLPTLFLIDGSYLLYRSYFAFIKAPLTTSEGLSTSAIFGFANTLMTILEKHRPTHVAIALDTEEPTARHKEYPAYKAQRDTMPEEIRTSFPYLFRLAEALQISVLRYPGYEADDVIGTLAKKAEQKNYITYIVTADKDFSQLVSPKIFLHRPGRSGDDADVLNEQNIFDTWQVQSSQQITDILALWGDTSDNIPGVPGIGEKTAKKLIASFGSLENLFSHLDTLKGKQKENLQSHQEAAFLYKRLVTINCDVPMNVSLDNLAYQNVYSEALQNLFIELEFHALAKKQFGKNKVKSNNQKSLSDKSLDKHGQMFFSFVEDDTSATDQEMITKTNLKTISDVQHSYQSIVTSSERQKLRRLLQQKKSFCFDTETTGLHPRKDRLLGIAFSPEPKTGYYLAFPDSKIETKKILQEFQEIFLDPTIEKIGHNLKFDLTILFQYGITVQAPLFDTMIAHYLIDPDSRHNMDLLANHYLEYAPISIDKINYTAASERNAGSIRRSTKKPCFMEDVPLKKMVEYAGEDADITLQLANKFRPLLQKIKGDNVFYQIEMKLLPVLLGMEYNGVKIDRDYLQIYAVSLEQDICRLQKIIFHQANMVFNLDSPKQLGDVLFGKLGLDDKAKRTKKSKQYNTSEMVLSRLAPRHNIVRDVLVYRKLKKLKTTYVDSLPKAIDPDTQRIHTTYMQSVAATGRIQSKDPNVQNIPIKTEEGKEIRKAFIPRDEKYVFLSADYSQIELRIIAALSEDPTMIATFCHQQDIHQITAAQIFSIATDDVDEDMRRKAKMVNFGIIYGISAFGLAQRLNVPRKEATFIIDRYFEQYPQVKDYMDKTISFAHENGYVQTLKGRRRYIRNINSQNKTLCSAAERNAINAPIQGTAADMIKIAMIGIHETLCSQRRKTKMVLQVHDELVFDLYLKEKNDVVPMVKKVMEQALPMAVPIVVDLGIGGNWLEAH